MKNRPNAASTGLMQRIISTGIDNPCGGQVYDGHRLEVDVISDGKDVLTPA